MSQQREAKLMPPQLELLPAYKPHIQSRIKKGVVLPADTTPFFYGYKEPLKSVPDGFGYLGTLATNEERTHVQCHICGLFFRSLAGHISKEHGLKASEYKAKFELMASSALIGEPLRKKRIEQMQHTWEEHYATLSENAAKFWEKSNARQGKPKTLEQKNREGRCPDQLLEKIKDLAATLERTPSINEFIKAYPGFIQSVTGTYRTWNNAVTLAGLVPRAKGQSLISDEYLLLAVHDFYYKYDRLPSSSDCRRRLLPHFETYKKRFGSLADACLKALPEDVIQSAVWPSLSPRWRKVLKGAH